MYEQVFSEFEVKNTSIKFHDDTTGTAKKAGCVGSLEESMNVKTIIKKCEGVVKKTVTKGDGTGELKLLVHMPYDIYLKSYGMASDGLVEGVYAYGRNSVHKPFTLTCEVYDEDGIKKLKAYPNCVISNGIARKIENGAEEVAEIEMTIAVNPDDEFNGMYEAIESNLKDEDAKAKWMSDFTPELVKKTVVA